MNDFVQQNTSTKKTILEEKEKHEKQHFITGKIHYSKSPQQTPKKRSHSENISDFLLQEKLAHYPN